MAYNGSGTFTRLYNWVTDRTNSIKIRADRMDAEMDGFASGLSNVICKDGQTTLTGDIPFSNRKITGLGDATLAADALNQQSGDVRYQKRVPLLPFSTPYFDDSDFLGVYDSASTLDLQINGANFRVDLLTRLRANGDVYGTGGAVVTVFRSTTAPTGWTKSTASNDRVLRVVSGALADAGSTSFSVAFPSQTPGGTVSISATTLATANLASHAHTYPIYTDTGPAYSGSSLIPTSTLYAGNNVGTSNTSGSGTSHTHTGTFTGNALSAFSPAYTDVIIASKN